MRCGSRRAVAERRRERENIHPPPDCMSRMGVAATVRVEPDVCFPSPHRHASGHRLTGQWAIPFITWEKPVPRLAAAKGLEQRQRVVADTEGAWRMADVIWVDGGARNPKVPTFFQVADVDTGVINWINADLVTHIVPRC